VRYTVPRRLARAATSSAIALMETPDENGVLVALILEPPAMLRFIRTRVGGPQEARIDVADLMPQKHRIIRPAWNADRLEVPVEPTSSARTEHPGP
jgi:hypothetical protein